MPTEFELQGMDRRIEEFISSACQPAFLGSNNNNSSGDETANVNFFYDIAHVQASAYAH